MVALSAVLSSSGMINLGAIIQGVVAAVAIISVAVIYFDRLSSMSHQMERVADSVDSVENEISSVNLEDMEKAIWRISFSEGEDPPPGNSVEHKLEESDVNVTISLASEQAQPSTVKSLHKQVASAIRNEGLDYCLGSSRGDIIQKYLSVEHGGIDLDEFEFGAVEEIETEDSESDDENDTEHTEVEVEETSLNVKIKPGDVIVVNFEFDEQINTRAVVGLMNTDEELAKKEKELFGHEGIFSATSPYELTYSIACGDFDKIAEVIEQMVEYMDEYNQAHEQMVEDFDSAVGSRLS